MKIMLKTIGSTGFYDGLFCYEILEALNDKSADLSKGLPLNYLQPLGKIMTSSILADSIIDAVLNGWISDVIVRTEIVSEGSFSYKTFINSELYNQNPNLKEKFYELLNHIEQSQYLNNPKKYYVLLDVKMDKIIQHLNDSLMLWREGNFFRNMSGVNMLVPLKQEEYILNFIYGLGKNGLDLKYFLIEFDSGSHSGLLQYLPRHGSEPEYNFHPYLALWSLQSKGVIKILFGESVNLGYKLQYRIEYIGSPVNYLLDKIRKSEDFAKISLLKREKLALLENDLSSFEPNNINDEILSLAIERLRTTIPKTTYIAGAGRPGTNSNFVSSLSENILDYKRIFEEFEERNGYKYPNAEQKNAEESISYSLPVPDKIQRFNFDKNTGKIYLFDVLIDEVSKGTNEYKLIEILSDNRGVICEYEKIKKHINPGKVSDLDSKYCQKIKSTLHQSVKKLIKAKGVGFLLDI